MQRNKTIKKNNNHRPKTNQKVNKKKLTTSTRHIHTTSTHKSYQSQLQQHPQQQPQYNAKIFKTNHSQRHHSTISSNLTITKNHTQLFHTSSFNNMTLPRRQRNYKQQFDKMTSALNCLPIGIVVQTATFHTRSPISTTIITKSFKQSSPHHKTLNILNRFFSTTTSTTPPSTAPAATAPEQSNESTTTTKTDNTTPNTQAKTTIDPNDVVSASIPKPRNSTDENQYKLGSNQWKKPTIEYQDMTDEQRQEIKERFTLENNQRITGALNKLRSTRGTMAYGQAQMSDSLDGSLPQRNGSMSGDVLNAFDRAEQYRRKMEAKKQQSELIQKQIKLNAQQKAEFEFDPRKALETDMGEFSKNADHLWKRESTPEEAEKQRAEQIMGKNWMARWF